MAGDDPDLCPVFYEQTQHSRRDAAGLEHILSHVAQDPVQMQFRVDDDYRDLFVDQFTDRIRDSI